MGIPICGPFSTIEIWYGCWLRETRHSSTTEVFFAFWHAGNPFLRTRLGIVHFQPRCRSHPQLVCSNDLYHSCGPPAVMKLFSSTWWSLNHKPLNINSKSYCAWDILLRASLHAGRNQPSEFNQFRQRGLGFGIGLFWGSKPLKT